MTLTPHEVVTNTLFDLLDNDAAPTADVVLAALKHAGYVLVLDQQEHVLDTSGIWMLQHPLDCWAGSGVSCMITVAARRGPIPRARGKYVVTTDENDCLAVIARIDG